MTREPGLVPHDELRRALEMDDAQLLRMLIKMFLLYPSDAKQGDREGRARAYLEELRDIPWWWVSNAMRATFADLSTLPPQFASRTTTGRSW